MELRSKYFAGKFVSNYLYSGVYIFSSTKFIDIESFGLQVALQ